MFFRDEAQMSVVQFVILQRVCKVIDVALYPKLSIVPQIEPRHEKTCLRGLQLGKTQTGLLSS